MNIKMNITKALAIIAMVVGHSRGPYVANIYLYHMVVFIFVSGYFYKDIYSNNIKNYV
ncbi:MAG: acyltransferase family protein [Sarcina sp.]